MSRRIYQSFAALLKYPASDYHALVWECLACVPRDCAPDISEFAAPVLGMTVAELQESFTSVFDLNPKCALELGWHLFGEKYERGLLLVRMRSELRRHGIPESRELPDHLTHALLLLGSMDREQAGDFAGAIVLPALAKLLAAMDEARNPYVHLMRAIDRFLRAEFPDAASAAAATPSLVVLQGVEQ